MIKIVIVGADGKMGRGIARVALEDQEVRLVGGVVLENAKELGSDLGRLAGKADIGLATTCRLEEVVGRTDVVLEFIDDPGSTLRNLAVTKGAGKAYLIGTTGHSPEQVKVIVETAQHIPVLMSANLSLGINLFLKLLPEVVRFLGIGYDVEIVDYHHRYKKDAPSGTALTLAEAIVRALGLRLEEVGVYGRQGVAPRTCGDIGIHALRAGGNPGEHRVILASDGEEIELIHRVRTRGCYALGALRAAKWLAGKRPGLYSFLDVMG